MSSLAKQFDVADVFARFETALLNWVEQNSTQTIPEAFYAGYRAGYGHCKEDAGAVMAEEDTAWREALRILAEELT